MGGSGSGGAGGGFGSEFGGFQRPDASRQVMADINVTPLVDVMLVLLVIFIITAPLLSYAIRLELPKEPAPATDAAAVSVSLSIDADGRLYWNNDALSDEELRARIAAAAQQPTPPELQLRADRATRYERVAFVLAVAQQAGLSKLGFVTDPEPAGHAGPGKPP